MSKKQENNKAISYRDAGVDVEAGNRFVKNISEAVARTHGPNVLNGIGGFGGLFKFDSDKYEEPVLVAGADGVGTKLRIAFMLDKHDTVGIDLVAMSVNDLIVCGAEPLFFLDYLACGKLSSIPAEQIVGGIAAGCEQSGCALLGGETAEMPSFYPDGEYDLAGFAVGVVDRKKIIDGSTVRPGDCLVALASSGIHSNGYSLVRRVLVDSDDPIDLAAIVPGGSDTFADALLAPTRIYAREITELVKTINVKAIAHITGGGLVDNLPRVLPDGCAATLDDSTINPPPIFEVIRERGGIEPFEMRRTFNLGVGMVLAVSPDDLEKTISIVGSDRYPAWKIGEIVEAKTGERVIFES